VAPEVLEELAARLQLLAATHPQLEVPRLDGDQRTALLTTACSGRTSFAELRAADLAAEWLAVAPDAVRGLLRREAPLTVRLPSGRELRVHYEAARPPWVASRLQDFFGQEQGPAVCGGRVPLTLHLLAPNQRPVQVTQDLRSFWRQHYPAIRRELSRRYPRHAWPEDGATAGPTAAPPARRSSPR
jgi:ATP-dependent helicase HrpB